MKEVVVGGKRSIFNGYCDIAFGGCQLIKRFIRNIHVLHFHLKFPPRTCQTKLEAEINLVHNWREQLRTVDFDIHWDDFVSKLGRKTLENFFYLFYFKLEKARHE
ncbi:hypothetical protein ABKN59_003501 [Abortiporus biennis]